jgi:hypothetical protein
MCITGKTKDKLKLVHRSQCTEYNLTTDQQRIQYGTESDRNFDISLLPEEATSIALHPWSFLWQWQPCNLRHPKESHKNRTLQVTDRLIHFNSIGKGTDVHLTAIWTGSSDISKGSLRMWSVGYSLVGTNGHSFIVLMLLW